MGTRRAFVELGGEGASDEWMSVSSWLRVATLHPANSASPGTAAEGNNKGKLGYPCTMQSAFSAAHAKLSKALNEKQCGAGESSPAAR